MSTTQHHTNILLNFLKKHWMGRFWQWALTCLILTGIAPNLLALPPAGFVQTELQRPDGNPWSEAVGLTFDENERLFVWERGGRIWIIDENNPVTTPFLNISDEVGAWSDHGLLGFALDPAFNANGYFYIFYIVDMHFLRHCTEPSGDGTPTCSASYDPNVNEYNTATIGRLVRYRAKLPSGDTDYARAYEVLPSSRRVLIGKTLSTGLPITRESHGVGTLLFGTDGTLIISTGDGARSCGSGCTPDQGNDPFTNAAQAISMGILKPKEDVGAFRSQLIDNLNGKILRLDPSTGAGIPSNPWYDASAPKSAKSRVWALGFRNPYRMTLKPGTGSHDPAAGNPGTLYVGDVGWQKVEELSIVTGPKQNFGWPIYEGMEPEAKYSLVELPNPDAPNPLYGLNGCTQEHFFFSELIQQDTLAPQILRNSCDVTQPIPASTDTFIHRRPAADWNHNFDNARWSTYNGTTAEHPKIGSSNAAGTKTVTGSQFRGNTSTGGVWYTEGNFPETYHGTYFHGDYGAMWIRNFVLDENDRLTAVREFDNDAGGVVSFALSPNQDALYYISWTAFVRKVVYNPSGSFPPVAKISSSVPYGPTPLTVNFDGTDSEDPEGDSLTYLWNFGDGSSASTSPTPSHSFTTGNSNPRSFTVSLKVTDGDGQSDTEEMVVSLNNTPPRIISTNPGNGDLYSIRAESEFRLSAVLADTESPNGLSCEWFTALHHNNHTHTNPIQTGCTNTVVLEALGCDSETFFYTVNLKVIDAHGLVKESEITLLPDCDGETPTADAGPDQTVIEGEPLTLSGSGSSDNGSIESYDWEQKLGSVSIASLADVEEQTFAAPTPTGDFEDYVFLLRVTDDDGYIATDTVTVRVTRDPNSIPSCANSICDNQDMGFYSTGSWASSDRSSEFLGIDYLHDKNGDKGNKTASWVYKIAANGTHSISAQWTAAYNRANDVQYRYAVNGGSYANCGSRVSQRADGGQMNLLCSISGLEAGDFLTVLLRNDATTGYVIADAVQVLKTGGGGGGGGGNQAPLASYSQSQQPNTLTMNFDAGASTDADGSIVSYAWTFGDGNSGSGSAPSHSYAAAGNYTVSLTVTDNDGAPDTASKTITVQAVGGQTCAIGICDNQNVGFATVGSWGTSTRNDGYYGQDYRHDGKAMNGLKSAIWSYLLPQAGSYEVAAQWNQASNRATDVQYRYSVDGGSEQACGNRVSQRSDGGQMNVLCTIPGLSAGSTLTIILRDDVSDGYVIADAVRVAATLPGGNVPPFAKFSSAVSSTELRVNFDASESSDPDGSIASYSWDFGDGSTGTGVSPNHLYAGEGSYTVELTVLDNEGAGATTSKSVSVALSSGDVCASEICDNDETGFSLIGSWGTSSNYNGYLGSDYRHDRNEYRGTKVASWRYKVSDGASRTIAARWSARSNRARDAQYRYSVNDGPEQLCGARVDQRQNGGVFNTLCTVSGLSAGDTVTVILRNDTTSGYTIADSVRLSP